MAKEPWLGPNTLPTVWIYICVLFNWVGVLTLIMLIIAELVVIVQGFTAYVVQVGYTYPSHGYPGSPECGFVDYTNVPKQLGGALWMLGYQLSIIVIATLAIASDLAWRTASYNEWGGRYVTAFFAVGILAGEHNKGLFYYVVANGFLKFWLVCLYLSQSFHGLNILWTQLRNNPQAYSSYGSGGYGSGGGAWGGSGGWGTGGGGYASTSISATTEVGVWKRNQLDGGATGAQAWAIWTGWILFSSILPSVIAFMYLVPWAAKVKEEGKPADNEKAAPAPAPAPPKEERKEAKERKERKERKEKPKKEG